MKFSLDFFSIIGGIVLIISAFYFWDYYTNWRFWLVIVLSILFIVFGPALILRMEKRGKNSKLPLPKGSGFSLPSTETKCQKN